MKNFTQFTLNFKSNSFAKFASLLGLLAVLLVSSNSFGQTVVTVGGGASVTCPATPTATWTTPPTGVTFSNWSRGSGVTCVSAGAGIAGNTFSSTSAAAAFTANKYFSVTITAAATHNFTLSSITWATTVSSGTCNFDVRYSNNGGTVTSFGSQGTSLTSNTFTGSVNVAAGTSIVLYLIPSSATSGSTVRWNNGSTITVTATAAGTTRTSNAVTGNWTSGSSWVGGTAPVAGDNVVIVSGANITFDAVATRNAGTTTTVNSGGTLTLAAAYTNGGTTTINGTVQVNGGGYASGTAFSYAATGSALIMNHNSGLYGISSGQAFWPNGAPPFDVTIQGTGAQINDTVGSVAGTLTVNSQLNCSTASALTITSTGTAVLTTQLNNTVSGAFVCNGTLRINGGGYVSTNSPTYGASSNLTYNTSSYTTTDVEFPSTGVANVTITAPTGTNTVTLNSDKTITGALAVGTHTLNGTKNISAATITVGTGSIVAANLTATTSLVCSGASAISVAGNWTVASFTKSTSTVTFNGTGSYNSATLFYNLTNASGTRSITQNMDVENTLAVTGGQMGVTGGTARTLTMSGAAAIINIAGGSIFGTDAGTNNDLSLVISGTQTTLTGNATGSNDDEKKFFNVTVNASRTLILSRGILCKYGTFTVNGTLQINANGYIQNNTVYGSNAKSPIYGGAALLRYNVGGYFGRGAEWTAGSGTIGTTAGYPNDIQVTNNTTLDVPFTANFGANAFSTPLALARDLTVDTGSALYMDYGGNANKSGSLTVGRNVVISGTLTLGNAFGGDMNVAGSWTRTGTFTPNGRAVQFNGGTAQTLTGATTFDFLTLGGNGGVTLQTSSAVTVNNTLTFGSGGTTGKLTLGANTLTIGATGGVSGASSSSFIVTNTNTSILKRNSVGNTATLFPVGNLSTSYTPLTITNTGTANDLSVGSSATIDNAVTDATKIVTLQWAVTSGGTGAVADITFNWNTGNQAASYVATGTGELGVYTTGPYAITSLGTMAGQTKSVTGVALASGTNKMVIGNTGGVYTPPPANDECTGAISLTVGATATSGNNASATKSNPSTITGTGYTTGTAKDMWYTFTPSCSGSHTITMTPTGFDGAVALFTGGSCPNPPFTSPLADSGTSGGVETITFSATAGVTYRILVWGYNSASGNFTVGVTSSVTPTFTLANTGTPATGNIASNTSNVVLYGFALTPAACTNSFDFTAASITTAGTATTADLSNFRLIVDANSNGLADSGEITAPIGTVSTLSGSLAFTVTGQTGLTAVRRYLLIADVDVAATGGNTFTGSMVAANITATAPVTVTGTATGNTQTITAAAIAIADNTQVTAGSIFRASTDNIISKAQLTVSGTSTTVTAMNFVTAGVTGGYTSADIVTGGFKLWVSTTNSFGSATQVGSGVNSTKTTGTNTETLSFATTQNLTIGTTYYYWLTADVAVTATVNRTITVNGLTTASVVSAGTSITGSTTAAGAQTIIAPTLVIANNTTVPAGNVLVNSTNNIIARAQFTITNATVGLSAMSYVTAANANGYTSADIATGGFKLWVNTTNTFAGATQVGTGQSSAKATANSTETITFAATQTLSAGTIYYYWLTADIASAATAGKLIIANGLAAASLTSTTTGVAISGTSSTSGTQTIVAPTLTIANNTQVTTQNLFAGSTNNIVSRAQVTPSFDNVSASAISFVTAGNATGYTSADIATGGFKLWVNTTNTFGTATQVGTGQSSTKTTATNTETITFTATQNFTLASVYYYWLTADIASGATVGDILVVNGLNNTSITTTTANAVVTGTTSATGNQTIVVPTVTLANTGTPAAGNIAVGANNVVLFGFGLTPNTSVDFTAASITTSGTATTSDLSNFRLVYDANANGLADAGEITGAIGTVSTLSGTLAFTGLTGQTAFSTVRRYLLIADASSGATSGRTFTGSLVAANITTTATTNTGSATGNAQTLINIPLPGEIVINQINYGYSGASDEYVELVNTTNKTFDLSLLKISYASAGGGAGGAGASLTGTLQPYSFWLVSPNATVNVGLTSSLARDGSMTAGFSASGGQIGLLLVSDNTQIDGVGYGSLTSGATNYYETSAAAGGLSGTNGYKRNIDGLDTNNGASDFSATTNATIYLRNSTGRLANSGATIAAGTYRDLSVTGSSSIAGNISLTGQLRLDNNGILATSSNVLSLSSAASVSRTSGWVNGNLRKNVATGATSRTFEIGGNTFYRPVTVAFASVTTAGDLTATVTTTAADHPGIADSGIDASKSVNRFWTLTNSGIAFTNYGATFTFDPSDVDSGAATANFIIRNYNGSWATSTAGTRTATTTQATGFTTFGDFVIGESTGAPTVATNPSNVSICVASATSFGGTSTSTPTPTIFWERGISGTYTAITSVLDGGVYTNFNTATLSISNTTGLDGYTYRAVFTNINGTVTTSAATLTTGATKTYSSGWSPSAPTTYDAAIISSDYSESADINACSLTVTSGNVIIPTGKNVTLSGPITVNSGATFTLSNDANLIQEGTSNTNTGNIKVKRDSSLLYRFDYTLWSSPVADQKLFAFSPLTSITPTVRFYTYNSLTDAYNSITSLSAGAASTDTFQTGTGYLIRMPFNWPTFVSSSTPGTAWTGTFEGKPNNGDIPVSISNLGDGFTAVGNPYPSAVSISSFLADNSSIDSALWFWRKTNQASGSAYVTYINNTYSSGPQAVHNIQPGQGFFVKYKGSGPTSINFKNTQRVGTNGVFFKNSNTTNNDDVSRVWLNLISQNTIVGSMAFGYKTGATNALDTEFDGKYINDSQLALNSIIDNTELSVQHRAAPFDTSDVVPLAFKTDVAGTYTIAINAVDGLFIGGTQSIYLKDKLTTTLHNLNTGAYTFASDAGVFNGRFEIVYVDALGVGNPLFTVNNVIIYGQDNQFVVNSGNVIMSSIKVFDIRGRLIEERKGINASQTTFKGGTANEVLLVQITSEDGVVVTKKVVR